MRNPRSTSSQRSRLQVEWLDDRLVPATLVDLTAQDSEGSANGAIFQQCDAQPTGTGVIQSFLRMQANGVEQGFNTDARPLQFDQNKSPQFTRSLTLGDVPVVTVNGTAYREFLLDINQKSSSTLLTLDELRIYVGSTGNLTGYDATAKTLAGLGAVYDMDGAGDASVEMDYRLNPGSGGGDVIVLIPDAAFADASASSFVYLFSKFGVGAAGNAGFEEWAVRSAAEPPPSTTASLSGMVYVERDGTPGYLAGVDTPVGGVQINLVDEFGNILTWVLTNPDGTYSFKDLPAGNYALVEGALDPTIYDPSLFYDYGSSVGTVDGVINGSSTGPNGIAQISLSAGMNGINYNFIEGMDNPNPT